MKQAYSSVQNPLLRVVVTWLWIPVGLLIVELITSVLLNIDLATTFKIYEQHRYLTVYIEIVSVGLLPLLFTVICRDELSLYGLCGRGFVVGLLPSLLFSAVIYSFTLIGWINLPIFDLSTVHLLFPWSVWYSVLGILAYGPLEVFFFVWLVANTDRVFKVEEKRISLGLILTVLLFTLFHMLTIRNVINTVNIGVIFLFLGLIFKYTGNSVGPMVAWTLINSQVYYFTLIMLTS